MKGHSNNTKHQGEYLFTFGSTSNDYDPALPDLKGASCGFAKWIVWAMWCNRHFMMEIIMQTGRSFCRISLEKGKLLLPGSINEEATYPGFVRVMERTDGCLAIVDLETLTIDELYHYGGTNRESLVRLKRDQMADFIYWVTVVLMTSTYLTITTTWAEEDYWLLALNQTIFSCLEQKLWWVAVFGDLGGSSLKGSILAEEK